MHTDTVTGTKIPWSSWAGSLLLFPLCVYVCLHMGTYTFFDDVSLVVHTLGAFAFSVFGPFMKAAGGTLFQILLPVLLVRFFYRHSYGLGTQVFLFWLGQNLINISVYVQGVQVHRLPHLADATHDWHYMLSALGIPEYDVVIASAFFVGGVLCFVGVVLLPGYFR